MESNNLNTNNNNDKKTNEKNSRETKQQQREVKRMESPAERLLKSMGSASVDEKMYILSRNFLNLEKEFGKVQSNMKEKEKQFELIQREKEHLQKAYNKDVLIRDKLEQVCREQQKLMKSIKSESLSKIRDEEEKCKETKAEFQTSINEIFAKIDKNNAENTKLKDANLEMHKKFTYLAEQYELREKQMKKINEQISLETQLNEAKIAKAQMEKTIEREISLKEKQTIQEELLDCRKAMVEMQTREKMLKEQLSLYTAKYEGFQSSLAKSNTMFSTYKVEMDKMSKKMRLLEKESCEWRLKFEKSNKNIIDMITDKQLHDKYVGKLTRQLTQLQKLCRTFQTERNVLIGLLEANNIERPALPECPAEPIIEAIEPLPKKPDKLDMMTKNCDELKKSLARLQMEMTTFTNTQTANNRSEQHNNKQPLSSSTSNAAITTSTNSNNKTKNKKKKSKANVIKEKTENNSNNDETKLNSTVNLTENPITNELISEVTLNTVYNDEVPTAGTDCDDIIISDLVNTNEIPNIIEPIVNATAEDTLITENDKEDPIGKCSIGNEILSKEEIADAIVNNTSALITQNDKECVVNKCSVTNEIVAKDEIIDSIVTETNDTSLTTGIANVYVDIPLVQNEMLSMADIINTIYKTATLLKQNDKECVDKASSLKNETTSKEEIIDKILNTSKLSTQQNDKECVVDKSTVKNDVVGKEETVESIVKITDNTSLTAENNNFSEDKTAVENETITNELTSIKHIEDVVVRTADE